MNWNCFSDVKFHWFANRWNFCGRRPWLKVRYICKAICQEASHVTANSTEVACGFDSQLPVQSVIWQSCWGAINAISEKKSGSSSADLCCSDSRKSTKLPLKRKERPVTKKFLTHRGAMSGRNRFLIIIWITVAVSTHRVFVTVRI